MNIITITEMDFHDYLKLPIKSNDDGPKIVIYSGYIKISQWF